MRVTNSHLPLVIDPFGAQNNIELPVVVAQNNNLPIVVEPVEAKIINDLPIVVQPAFSQSKEISSDLCCFCGGGVSHNEDIMHSFQKFIVVSFPTTLPL